MTLLYQNKYIFLPSFDSSADVNPDNHMKILEALIVVGGLTEMQAAPGRQDLHFELYEFKDSGS